MQAGAAQGMRIDQGDVGAFRRGVGSGDVACGTAAGPPPIMAMCLGMVCLLCPSGRQEAPNGHLFSGQTGSASASTSLPLRVTWPLTSMARIRLSITGQWLSTVCTSFMSVSVSAGLFTSVSKMIFW